MPPSATPSAGWYAATLGIGAAALVVAVVMLVGGVREARSTGSEATRVDLGQPSPVTFDHADSFTLSYIGPVQVDTADQVAAFAARIGAELRPERGGDAVVMAPYEGSSGLTRGRYGEQQVSLATFHIDQPGTYTMTSSSLAGVDEFDAQLVVATSPYRPLKRGAVLALVTLGVGTVVSLVASVALGVTRSRSRKAIALAFGAGSPGGRPPGGWPPPGAGQAGPGAGSGAPPGWYGPPPIIPPPPPGYGPEAHR